MIGAQARGGFAGRKGEKRKAGEDDAEVQKRAKPAIVWPTEAPLSAVVAAGAAARPGGIGSFFVPFLPSPLCVSTPFGTYPALVRSCLVVFPGLQGRHVLQTQVSRALVQQGVSF
jgi:hypothetical protein